MDVALVCAVIGEGNVFVVRIDGNQFVLDLKNAIRREIEDLTPKTTRAITLYLAKRKRGGTWLVEDEVTEKMLVELKSPETQFNELRSSFRIKNSKFGFPREDDNEAEDGVIHILVGIEKAKSFGRREESLRQQMPKSRLNPCKLLLRR